METFFTFSLLFVTFVTVALCKEIPKLTSHLHLTSNFFLDTSSTSGYEIKCPADSDSCLEDFDKLFKILIPAECRPANELDTNKTFCGDGCRFLHCAEQKIGSIKGCPGLVRCLREGINGTIDEVNDDSRCRRFHCEKEASFDDESSPGSASNLRTTFVGVALFLLFRTIFHV